MTTQTREVPLTRTAIDEMQRELEYLKTVRRREIAEEIRDAWESELDKDVDVAVPFESAKQDQAWVEGRIAGLEDMLGRAIVLDEEAARRSATVTIGSVVTLTDGDGRERTFQIVSAAESDPGSGKLSQESPVGAAIFGRRAGERVTVQTPSGTKEMRIVRLHERP